MENTENQITIDETVAITNTSMEDISFDIFDDKLDARTNKIVNKLVKVTYKAGETKIMLGGVGAIHAQALANIMVIEHNNPNFAWNREQRDSVARSLMQRADDVLSRLNPTPVAPQVGIPQVSAPVQIDTMQDVDYPAAGSQVVNQFVEPSTISNGTDASGSRPEFE